jgi:hypothetical protein
MLSKLSKPFHKDSVLANGFELPSMIRGCNQSLMEDSTTSPLPRAVQDVPKLPHCLPVYVLKGSHRMPAASHLCGLHKTLHVFMICKKHSHPSQ